MNPAFGNHAAARTWPLAPYMVHRYTAPYANVNLNVFAHSGTTPTDNNPIQSNFTDTSQFFIQHLLEENQ